VAITHFNDHKIMVALRLSRQGTKDRPYYKIVAVDSRKRRDGRPIEQLGTYNPMIEGVNYSIDIEKAEKWIGHGAQASETVNSIIKKAKKQALEA
jgi:small subunit ribosomal protein S16